jgi:hypothetical protein
MALIHVRLFVDVIASGKLRYKLMKERGMIRMK